jgi:GNAT superfamily N-acetyltransferase
MLFPDLTLAQRLERHEAWSTSEHARTQVRLYPETGAMALPIAEGRAVYCGRKSLMSTVYGWGLAGPVLASDLDRIEAFYRGRTPRIRVRLCPLAHPSLLHLLGERGYTVQDHMNVFARPMGSLDAEPSSVPGLSIRVATPEEARLWFESTAVGLDWAEPDGPTFMTIRSTLKSDTRLFLAWLDGQSVGGGALEAHEGVASLMAAETLPAYRSRGIHTALVHARLAAAREAGCDLAMVYTRPGAVSQRNVLRAGFQLAYTLSTMVSPS